MISGVAQAEMWVDGTGFTAAYKSRLPRPIYRPDKCAEPAAKGWIRRKPLCSIFVTLGDDQGSSPALPALPGIPAGRTSTRTRAAWRQKPSSVHLRRLVTVRDENRPCR